MKRFATCFIMLISAFTFCFVSCTGQNEGREQKPDESVKPKDTEQMTLEAGTYTFTVSALKKQWVAGDKIYVHGSYGPEAKVITLEATNISADGKTASANLDSVTEFPLKPDGLYAAWPAECIEASEGMQEPTLQFSEVTTLLNVAYLQGKNFAFVDVSSGLTFKADGFARFALAGKQRPGIRFTGFEPKYMSGLSDFSSRKSDGYPFIYGSFTDGAASLWFPGTVSFKQGLTIYLSPDGEKWTHAYTIPSDVKLKEGEIKDLGDITSSVEAYSGLDPKMPEIGKATKYSVAIGDLSGLCLSKDKDFIWAAGNSGSLGKIAFDGTISDVHSIGGDDEGITLDPETGILYIAQEPYVVASIEPGSDFSYEGKAKAKFKIYEAHDYSNSGMEGITYYKDGLIYCGMQTGAELYLCDLNAPVNEKLHTTIVWVKSLSKLHPQIREVGGLFYDELTDWLWVTDSESRKLFALSGDAEQMLGSYSVKQIGNAESICVDHAHSCIWVGHDPDGNPSSLYKIEFTGLDDAIIKQ